MLRKGNGQPGFRRETGLKETDEAPNYMLATVSSETGAGSTEGAIAGAGRDGESGTAGDAGMEGAWLAAARPLLISSETVTSS